MNIKDSYIHGADGKGVVKFLYFASAAENNILGVDGNAYNAKAKDLIFLLADIGGTKIGLSIPTWNLNTTGSAGSVLTVKQSTDSDHFLTFVDSNNDSETAENIYTAADIKYNPSTKILTVPNLSTNSGITIGGTFVAIGGTYSPVTSITADSTDDDIPSAAAVWAMLSSGLQANDAMVFKGVLNGATNTIYTPAADCGHVYKVAVAGKINGDYYEVGDTLICAVDNTAAATSSNVSTVKANWYAIQTNITDYLLKSGGTMTGNLKWKDTTALPTITSMANTNILVVDGMGANTEGTTKQISLASLLTNMNLSPSIGDGTNANTVKITVNGTDSSDYTIPYATSATNLTGGALGSIPYLTAVGTTQLLAGGSNNLVLRYDGTNKKPYWGADIDTTGVKLATVSGTAKTDSTVIKTSSSTGLSLLGVTNYIKIGDGTNYIQVPVTVDHTVATADAGAEKLLSGFPKGLSFLGTYNKASYTTPFPTSYGGVITMNETGGSLIYVCWQGGYTDSYTDDLLNAITTEMYLRNRRDNQTKWTGWTRVLTNKNYSSFASPLSHTHSVTINGSSKTIPASGEDPVDLGSYLPSTGGTLSLSTVDSLIIKKTTNTASLIKFTGWKSTDTLVSGYDTDTDYGYIGFVGANNPVFRHTNTTSYTLAHAGNITQSADPVVLAWNTSKTIATIAGIDINVKLPSNPNTWRNIYVGGTSKVGTGTDTKAINFAAGTAISLGFTAAGTGTGLNSNYFSVTISGIANDKDNPGYVAAPKNGSNYLANKVWKTDANGNPAWRDDANTWVANVVGVAGYVAAPTAASNKNHVWMTNANGEPAWRGVTIDDVVPTIGTSDTILVTIGGVAVKAKIGSYSASNHNHDRRYLREYGTIDSGNTLFDIDVDPGSSGEITYDPVAANVDNTINEQNPNVTALNLGNSFSRRKQLIFTYNNDNIYYRRHLGVSGNNPAYWTTAVKLIHTGNVSPSLDIDGNKIRSTVGGINSSYITVPYATSAGSVAWENITDKPSTFTPSAHRHNINDIKWPGGHNLITSATANNQEWSIDLTPGTYTGTYWHVWRATTEGVSVKGTLLRVTSDTGKVSAPYGFVGNLEGNASTATSATNADKLDDYHESSFFRYRGAIAAAYVDLTTYTANAENYQNPLNGIYTVSRSGYSAGFIAFTGAGSASGLDIYFHYERGKEFKFRRRIDANRLSGAWETFITDVNISPSLLIDEDTVAVEVGGVTSSYITIPYATLSASLVSEEIYNGSKTLDVNNWTTIKDISSYTAGTYVISISSSNLYASGIFSICNGTDVMTDEIVLHVSNKTNGATWRPYARISSKNLELSCNETTGTARTYIVKILKLI